MNEMAKKRESTPGENLTKQIIKQHNPKSVVDISDDTGKLEDFNNKIKVAKRIGYGYRDDDFFFTLIRYLSIPSVRSPSHKNRDEGIFETKGAVKALDDFIVTLTLGVYTNPK